MMTRDRGECPAFSPFRYIAEKGYNRPIDSRRPGHLHPPKGSPQRIGCASQRPAIGARWQNDLRPPPRNRRDRSHRPGTCESIPSEHSPIRLRSSPRPPRKAGLRLTGALFFLMIRRPPRSTRASCCPPASAHSVCQSNRQSGPPDRPGPNAKAAYPRATEHSETHPPETGPPRKSTAS